ncbi:hypothetical protein RB195_019839 [Necator americanus]|uniref:Uncharacterized protein n=1 Tax=Necator americanus TaxID=51031 RepID=A0ABR1CG05_NECAM
MNTWSIVNRPGRKPACSSHVVSLRCLMKDREGWAELCSRTPHLGEDASGDDISTPIKSNSKPQEMKWSFILCFIALICAGVLETVAGDSINRPWMGGFPTDSPAPQ